MPFGSPFRGSSGHQNIRRLKGVTVRRVAFSRPAKHCGFAEEIRVFAENCKSGIKQQATNTYNELLGKIKKIVDERKKLEDKKAADNIKIQKEQENERMLKEVNIRLMRRLINKYVATGVIIDEPLESGEMVYYLAVDNQKKYRLVTIVPNLNLRDYWRREVGIVGKIVYDEDEEYPIVLCESVQIFDK